MGKIVVRAASLLAGLAIASTATIAGSLPAGAASTCRITFDSYGTVRAGSHGLQAKAAQCLLKAAGYDNVISLTFSSGDASKLKKFQSAHKLSPSGVVDAKAWTALLSRGSTPTLHYGSRGANVQRLQRALTASGRSVPATGWFGPITQGAVRSVQKAQGWRATGVATTGVWRALQSGGAAKVTVFKATPTVTAPQSAGGKGLVALAYAKKQLGDAYAYGGTGPNAWDCSGLTMKSWAAAGVKLPHSAAQQFTIGKKVSKSDLKLGDLVFFYPGIRHVALYAGNGMVIHASHPGSPVAYIKMKYMPYMGARRPG
jgi:cell wall-associated NlpC family hydrolase